MRALQHTAIPRSADLEPLEILAGVIGSKRLTLRACQPPSSFCTFSTCTSWPHLSFSEHFEHLLK